MRRASTAARRRLAGLLLAAACASQGAAQQAPAERPGADCPYCGGDPERMRAAGVVSHGGFAFGTGDTAATERILADVPLVWIETAHFEIGLGLDEYRIPADERDLLRAELEELQRVLPAVSPRTRVLDPWLRLHLYAQRTDHLWRRMLEVLQKGDADFPAAGETWQLGEPYRGEGPHLGMGGKYELLIVPSLEAQTRWLGAEFGLRTQRTQRWNVADTQSLLVVVNADEERLRKDAALHGHVVFSLAINLVDGYRFYAYETPVWLREGLAHVLEHELDPRHNSFSYSEAALAEETRRSDWHASVRKLVQGGQAPSIAELVHLQTTAQFTLEHHYTAWSMTLYLLEEHARAYACLLERLHGIRDARGNPDGSGIVDKHRSAFEECTGLRYQQFDEAWRSWAERQEDPRRRDAGKRFRMEQNVR